MLRDYQQRAIDQLYQWMRDGGEGNPCLVLPTGAGKSHIVAALCKDAVQNWPDTRILMLTHVKELILQNAEKMREHWPNAPLGIYSASIGRKELDEPITFAGIQSIAKKSAQIGHVDLIIIDECHLVSHKDEGGYRSLIAELTAINPALRVIGLTATPYRLGHGLITDAPAIFSALIEPVSIEELIYKGFLATLRSKPTKAKLSTDGVHKRGGEFIESELQAAMNTDDNNYAVVREIISRADDRKAWLFFCAGVAHAEAVRDVLKEHGVTAECVTGATSKTERERILREYKAGKIKALTNANVLTTGFDYPNIDLIAMMRPTMSPALYVQMAGRGLRPKEHTDHCLVLDFAGAVEMHGPITAVKPPKKGTQGNGEAPVKVCDECFELVAISARSCPSCGWLFPEVKKAAMHLRQDDIMGLSGTEMDVTSWTWRKHTSRASGKEMLMVTYYGGLSDYPVSEYITVLHDGLSGQKALRTLASIARNSGVEIPEQAMIDSLIYRLNAGRAPLQIEYIKDGKFFNVKKRSWTNETPDAD